MRRASKALSGGGAMSSKNGASERACGVVWVGRRDASRLIATAICGLVLGACANSSNGPTVGSINPATAPANPSEKAAAVKVAMLLPLSSGAQTAAVAKGLQQAAELAVFERNTPSLQLLIKDDKGSEQGARIAAEEAIKEGAEVIIGPLFAKSVAAAAPVARHAGVPIIAFSNDARVAGSGVYLLSFLASQEVPRVVAFTASQGRKRFAALLPDDAHGKLIEPLFRDAVEQNGGSVVAIEHYPIDLNGMIDPARRMREAVAAARQSGEPIDALFLPGGPDTIPLIGPMLPRTDFDPGSVKIIGTGGWDYPNARSERILESGWFAAPDPSGWRDFSERFAKAYKNMPPRLASLAYDAVTVVATFVTAPKADRYAAANLTRSSGFTGIDGAFRLLPNGLSERGLAILEMRKSGPAVADPAADASGRPQAFAATAHAGIN